MNTKNPATFPESSYIYLTDAEREVLREIANFIWPQVVPVPTPIPDGNNYQAKINCTIKLDGNGYSAIVSLMKKL